PLRRPLDRPGRHDPRPQTRRPPDHPHVPPPPPPPHRPARRRPHPPRHRLHRLRRPRNHPRPRRPRLHPPQTTPLPAHADGRRQTPLTPPPSRRRPAMTLRSQQNAHGKPCDKRPPPGVGKPPGGGSVFNCIALGVRR